MSSELAIENNVNLAENTSDVTIEEQKSFLETNLGQIINSGIDLGLRALLPDVIEDEIIEIKDSILTDGFAAGIKTAIDNVVDMGKSVLRHIYRKIRKCITSKKCGKEWRINRFYFRCYKLGNTKSTR